MELALTTHKESNLVRAGLVPARIVRSTMNCSVDHHLIAYGNPGRDEPCPYSFYQIAVRNLTLETR